MLALSLVTNFPSRIGRAQWWLGMAVIGAVVSGALALGGDRNALIMLGAAAVSLAIFVPITRARLHDRNRSAGTAFYYVLLVFPVAKLFRNTLDDENRWLALTILGLILATWAVIELGCLRGTIGRNPYGDDPLGEPAEIA